MSEDDLKQLPPPPLDDLMVERVRRRAQAVLAEERRLMSRPLVRRVARVWRSAEPILVAAACVIYLVWALDFTANLYR